jgi:hypothetical protein
LFDSEIVIFIPLHKEPAIVQMRFFLEGRKERPSHDLTCADAVSLKNQALDIGPPSAGAAKLG